MPELCPRGDRDEIEVNAAAGGKGAARKERNGNRGDPHGCGGYAVDARVSKALLLRVLTLGGLSEAAREKAAKISLEHIAQSDTKLGQEK